MLRRLLAFFDRNAYRREVERYRPLLAQINALESHYRGLNDAGLRNCTDDFRQRLQAGSSQEELLPEAFAAVREAAWRSIGLRHYDVQLIGGIVLQRGAIAELRTGEGKTLAATLPLYLQALQGRGAHLVTVNDYLARRDARWMGPVFHLLDLSVGLLQADDPDMPERTGYLFDPGHRDTIEKFDQLRRVERRAAYTADITYGTNSEFGFDYLRDNLAQQLSDKCQRGHAFAIIDEVDNILIDEARTPLIISGENRSQVEWYSRIAHLVAQLKAREVDVDRRQQVVTLLPAGEAHLSALLGVPLVDSRRPEEASPQQRHLAGHIEQALRARFLFQRDRDYVVQEQRVVIVDEFTGRMMPGRRWTDGLHQAVEAKEGLEVQSESITFATISLQNYFRMYHKLSGMTGTALSASPEFEKIYHLKVHPIPTHVEYQALGKTDPLVELQLSANSLTGQDMVQTLPGQAIGKNQPHIFYTRRDDPSRAPLFWKRVDYPDQLFMTAEAKRRAILWEILRLHSSGRPLLVGTTSVADSEDLSRSLQAPFLQRLAQARLLRSAWQEAFPAQHPQLPVLELSFLEAPLGLISPQKLEQAFRALQLAPSPLAHLERLRQMLSLPTDSQPRLENALRDGVPNSVLNARYHYEESQIIAGAGALGSVVIATNMAGRGVDIRLGGELAEEVSRAVNRLLEGAGISQPYALSLTERRQALLALARQQTAEFQAEVDFFARYVEEMEKVRRLGGLHVIAGARHEARRIDYQLRGRAARQGDPGSSQTFVSMEDELIARFGSLEAEAFLEQEALRGGDPLLPAPYQPARRVIEAAQNRVEGENFEIRRHLLEYDDVINSQRLAIYSQRDRILAKVDLCEDLVEMLEAELESRLKTIQAAEPLEPWSLLAWVERLQPAFWRLNGELYPSFALRLVSLQLLTELGAEDQPDRVRSALLEMGERLLQAEARRIQEQAQQLCLSTLAEMEGEISNRMQAVQTYLEGLNFYPRGASGRRPAGLSRKLSQVAGCEIGLSAASLAALSDDARPAYLETLDQVERCLLQQAATQISTSLARLLARPAPVSFPALTAENQPPAGPSTLLEGATGAVQAEFAARRQRWLGPQGVLAEVLDKALAQTALPLSETGCFKVLGRMCAVAEGQGQPAPEPIDPAAGAPQPLQQTLSPPAPALKCAYLAAELLSDRSLDDIAADAWQHLSEAQQALQEDLGCQALSEVYRQLLLRSIDGRWVDYLTSLEELRYEVRLEGWAHTDPLVAYKSRASEAYSSLLVDLRREVVSQMFHPLAAAGLVGAAEASATEQPAPRLTYLKLG